MTNATNERQKKGIFETHEIYVNHVYFAWI